MWLSRFHRRPVLPAAPLVLATLATLLFGAGPVRAQADEDKPLRLPVRIRPERAEVDLVLIDVLVSDKKGSAVSGLTREDFNLEIDDRPEPIDTFESYCRSPVVGGGKSEATGAPAGAGEQAQGSEAAVHFIVLYFDISQLTERGRDRSIAAAVRYVKEQKRDRDQVMIIAMKRQPELVQAFTSDRDLLESSLLAMRTDPNMIDRHYLEERLNINEIVGRSCLNPGPECSHRASIAVPYAEEEMLRTKRSLDALRNLMPALASIRGRKTVVHFSEALRDEPGIEYLILAGSTPSWEGIDVHGLIDGIYREANAAGVSLYMVWAAGLGEKDSTDLADASRILGPADTVILQHALLGGEDAALSLGKTLSLETGGVATQRTNDLGRAFDSVQQDLSCYYVLGYRNKGPGDGDRHMIKVKMGQKGLRVRHRPYYEDWSEDERLRRRFESALMAPAYFTDIPVRAEAYALAPEKSKTPILVKVEFPMEAVTLVHQPDDVRYGEAEVRATIWTGSKQACQFQRRIPIIVETGEEVSGRKVIYEAGCNLPPGEHDLTVAVLDSGTWMLGSAELAVPVQERSAGVAGDVVLWTPSGKDLLVASDAASIGIHSTGSEHGFVPRAKRLFGRKESSMLYVVVCRPEEASGPEAGGEAIRVRRRLFSGDTEVATYGEVNLASRGGADAGVGEQASSSKRSLCEGLFSPIPAGKLGPGGYQFEIEVDGVGESPIVRRAGIAVAEAASRPPDW
ncbi:MAG TPA: VWA domain-containing protein [Candidatus Saccharimonadales bacterium]|nr:VWA domain-containing protein [Candidatus Saccharimonadales bacterium]